MRHMSPRNGIPNSFDAWLLPWRMPTESSHALTLASWVNTRGTTPSSRSDAYASSAFVCATPSDAGVAPSWPRDVCGTCRTVVNITTRGGAGSRGVVALWLVDGTRRVSCDTDAAGSRRRGTGRSANTSGTAGLPHVERQWDYTRAAVRTPRTQQPPLHAGHVRCSYPARSVTDSGRGSDGVHKQKAASCQRNVVRMCSRWLLVRHTHRMVCGFPRGITCSARRAMHAWVRHG